MKRTARGFTLVELLVVIAIVAILAAIVVLVINPVEITKRGRDATRLADLATLQQALTVTLQEVGTTAAVLCNDAAVLSCSGKSTDTDAAKASGIGWVKVNLAGQTTVRVPALPVDPTNDATSYYLYYYSNGTDWEIMANLESTQHSPREGNDGGDCPTKYEVGSKLTLVPAAENQCT